ncbi:hypothetical protein AAC387_Pa01g0701 [Persea americana]
MSLSVVRGLWAQARRSSSLTVSGGVYCNMLKRPRQGFPDDWKYGETFSMGHISGFGFGTAASSSRTRLLLIILKKVVIASMKGENREGGFLDGTKRRWFWDGAGPGSGWISGGPKKIGGEGIVYVDVVATIRLVIDRNGERRSMFGRI